MNKQKILNGALAVLALVIVLVLLRGPQAPAQPTVYAPGQVNNFYIAYTTNNTNIFTTNLFVWDSVTINTNLTVNQTLVVKGQAKIVGNLFVSSLTATNGITNQALTANTVVKAGANKQLASIANGPGVLSNDGAGGFSWTTAVGGGGGGGSQNVSSETIPMGAWFNVNVADGATIQLATPVNVTNTGDGCRFDDAVTNAIRTRWTPPWDWDAGTVKLGIRGITTGTNSLNDTNVVYAVRATCFGNADLEDNPTWSSLVYVTNALNTNIWYSAECITAAITVGNSPSTAKSVLFELQRVGAFSAGDSVTNTMAVNETRLYYQRAATAAFPTSSP